MVIFDACVCYFSSIVETLNFASFAAKKQTNKISSRSAPKVCLAVDQNLTYVSTATPNQAISVF
jgi:hypothetical protein